MGGLLLSLGLLGCLLHRDPARVLGSSLVALSGAALLLNAACLFHGESPSISSSLAVLACGTAVFLSLRARLLMNTGPVKIPDMTEQSDSSPPDSSKLPKIET